VKFTDNEHITPVLADPSDIILAWDDTQIHIVAQDSPVTLRVSLDYPASVEDRVTLARTVKAVKRDGSLSMVLPAGMDVAEWLGLVLLHSIVVHVVEAS
jgi:hypothetical protein